MGETVIHNCQQMVDEWLIMTGKQMIKPHQRKTNLSPLRRIGLVSALALLAAAVKIVVSYTGR
jgi:hypothetical protein